MAFTQPEHVIEQIEMRPDMVVADLGAGTGAYTIAAARKLSGGKVLAVEVQKELLEQLTASMQTSGITNVETLWGNIEKVGGTKIEDDSVDLVILSNILFQVEDREGLLDEVDRILKSDGKVLLIDWSESFGGLGPHQSQLILEDTARELFESHGFSTDEEVTVGEHHYGFIAHK